jgi:ech hydrogenase subunit A
MLFCLLGLPLICGTLAWLVKSSLLRNALIVFSALAVAVCGVALVVLSAQAPDGVWSFAVAPKFEWIGSVLEAVMVAVILIVAIKIRNTWIILMGIAQLLMVIGCYFIKPAEHHELLLFQIDNLSRILLLVTCIVGSTILVFAIGYMKQHQHHAPPGAGSLGRFFFFFIGFLGFMVGLVASNNLSFFSFFWEATTLCSYALIGQDGGEARRVNATRALLINSFGGTLLILGVLLIKLQVGGESFAELIQNNTLTLVPAVLLCVAAFTKSALFPFQSWLLGAMVAPTPVSAMLHSATMVKAGVYLVMRITPGFYDQKAMLLLAFAGALTFVGGALLACTQSNAKKVLAYSTISNLGLIVACAGLNTPLAYAAGLAIISFHAISKGLLFLCVGNIEQKIGSRDIEVMDGLLYKMPFTAWVTLLGMMSMLLPPFGMLLSKWLAIEATIRSPLLFIFMVIGSALTVFFWAKWIGRMQNIGYHEHIPREQMAPSVRLALSIMAFLVIGTGVCTMWIFVHFFSPMAKQVFSGHEGVNWQTFNEAKEFFYPAMLIFGAMLISMVIYYFTFWRRFRPSNVRLPFLCGENVDMDQLSEAKDVRSYDFHSIYDRVEHTVISSMYLRGIISEEKSTRWLNWLAWLIIIALVGLSIASIANR